MMSAGVPGRQSFLLLVVLLGPGQAGGAAPEAGKSPSDRLQLVEAVALPVLRDMIEEYCQQVPCLVGFRAKAPSAAMMRELAGSGQIAAGKAGDFDIGPDGDAQGFAARRAALLNVIRVSVKGKGSAEVNIAIFTGAPNYKVCGGSVRLDGGKWRLREPPSCTM
jgi:hypothetical protein